MRLRIVNEFSIETESGIVRRLRTRKAEELLAFLALHPSRWISREELTDMVWPGDDAHSARQKLRLALHSIRSVIGDRLETDRDLVRVTGLAVDFAEADFRAVAPGWRLMPGHEAEWLDTIAAAEEARQQLSAVGALTGQGDDRAASLAYLIASDPGEPRLYGELHGHYVRQGSLAAAQVVASFARLNLGRRCPPELSDPGGSAVRSDFVGRLRELAVLAEALLGPSEPVAMQLNALGGMGKTRLARELSTFAAAEDLPVCWVNLSGVVGAAEAEGRFRAAVQECLSLSAAEVDSPAEIPSVLVVLDQVDELPAGALGFLNRFLVDGCGVRVLATGQQRRAEIADALIVHPLTLPRGPSLAQVQQSEAVSLLVFLSGKPLSEENRESFALLAEASGGVPLAVNLIGAEGRYRALAELVGSIRRASGKWAAPGKGPEVAERHRSLEATLAWSFGLLPVGAQRAVQRLAALEDEFDAAILEPLGVAAEDFEPLVRSHWVSCLPSEGVYRLLPPIQQFLRGRDPAAVADARDKVREFLVHEIASNYPERYGMVTAVADRYQADIEALEATTRAEDLDSRGALLVGLQVTAHRFGRVDRFRERMAALLAEREDPHWRTLLGNTEYIRRDFEAARGHFERLREVDDPEMRSVALANIALVQMSTGHAREAADLLARSVAETAVARRRGARLISLCSCLCLVGDFAGAIARAQEAQTIFEFDEPLPAYSALCHQRRAEAEFLSGDSTRARTSALLALDGFEETRQWHHMVDLALLLALLAADAGDVVAVRKWGLSLLDQRADSVAICGGLFAVLTRLGRPEEAQVFAAGIDHGQLPILLKCVIPDGVTEARHEPRTYWIALARQTLKHL